MTEDSKQIALQRIQILFRLAKEAIHDKPDLAQRYIVIARKIAMRTRLHLPPQYRLLVCKHCKRFILPGVNSRVRTQPRGEPHIVVTCLHCGGKMRMPLRRKKRQ
jgi:ribonuclease P protein subunit RPR2